MYIDAPFRKLFEQLDSHVNLMQPYTIMCDRMATFILLNEKKKKLVSFFDFFIHRNQLISNFKPEYMY